MSRKISKNPKSVPHPSWGAERLYYLSHSSWNKKLKLLARFFKYLNMFIFRTYIDPSAKIGQRLQLAHGGLSVVIGPKTRMGDDAIIFQNVTIGSAKPGYINIGDRVCIGAGAIILGPVNIGHDVWIGANAVVNFDVPNGATVVGAKGRILMRQNEGVK